MKNSAIQKITIPENWTGEQAFAVSHFINLIDDAIWEAHHATIIEEIQRRNEVDAHHETQLNDNSNEANGPDNDIPW